MFSQAHRLHVESESEYIAASLENFASSLQLVDPSLNEITHPNTLFILTTGGTIAGTADSSTSSHYEAGKLSAIDLLSKIPELQKYPHVQFEDLYNIDSADITDKHWLKLQAEVNRLLKNPHIKGLVITHGTDTLEETAYFLNLVVKSDKPVVLVGSMRPATSLGADGPLNLLNALAVIDSPDSKGKGVMVVMNEVIFSARDVTKSHTTRVDTFMAPNGGIIGSVNFNKVRFNFSPTHGHTIDTPFDLSAVKELPEVEILTEYACSTTRMLNALIESNPPPQGVVIAGVGNGNIPQQHRDLIQAGCAKGIQFVRGSRTGGGYVDENPVLDLGGLIPSGDLSPPKARILLMLSLILVAQEYAKGVEQQNQKEKNEIIRHQFSKF